ncbi:YsnF/AvaK domain-containing protein [Rhizobium sp. BK661]|uniref:YsnF/AvaK domain-containing protein n=1 Tax=Rhizobium sp. BK661 TaxID=2586991 RepID=UPI002169FEE4|nr:YsnF/AvaK domain-containing protein [Rhizobium sp. BK661]MCS3743623.1 uncharacterized protein (TIGR02271 family) [Rhizobium sp. BK661]
MANLYNENAPASVPGSSYSTLSAFFDTRSEAEDAISRLKDAGIGDDSIRFLSGYESDNDRANVASDDRSGFWAKLEDWFFPDEDRATYAEGLRRGGFLVSVHVDDANYETAHDILDDEGSIDIDERADQWRSEGWQARSSEAYGTSTYDRNAANERRTSAGSGLSEQRKFNDDLDRVVPQANASREDAFDAGDRDQSIPVVEENLRVGKRDVNHGSVRVRAYTVEEPVQEDVRLHEENVEIERRIVDRPVSDADDAFRDRTISAEEHHEEAVVQKEARVVEEIGIRKTASEQTKTIDDTVRKTEVEIDDGRSRQSQSQNSVGQSQTGQNNSFRQD